MSLIISVQKVWVKLYSAHSAIGETVFYLLSQRHFDITMTSLLPLPRS
jgi:hypothetical protein